MHHIKDFMIKMMLESYQLTSTTPSNNCIQHIWQNNIMPKKKNYLYLQIANPKHVL
jgi:hypothetical protein